MQFHKPVMIKEAVQSLNCKRGGVYVDGTIGGGGHAHAILEQSAPDGLLIGIDLDDEALAASEKRLRLFDKRVILLKGNFVDIAALLEGLHIQQVDGILFDLGVSSHQLEMAERGFSFLHEGPLDMRMNRQQSLTACDLVNKFSEDDLEKIIREYGEERRARRIARAIGKRRDIAPILTTTDLASVVTRSVSSRSSHTLHPATRTFQAIRIAVNNELARLPEAIGNAINVLSGGGRISVISFHSLEDRIVKQEFRKAEGECSCLPHMPICRCQKKIRLRIVTKKPIMPGLQEVAENPRARSARLRTAERI